MYAKPADIEKYLSENPKKPYISCEYMHAMGNSLGGMKKYTDLEQKYQMYQGGFIWDYIDQSIVKKDRFGEEFLAYGGDFEDRPTDYGFCTNGIVYANRELSPKMQEVKFLYQNVKLVPDRHGVSIINENLFSDTSNYVLEYALFHEGNELHRNQFHVDVAPQSEGRAEFEWPAEVANAAGEYCIHVSFKLKETHLWADSGYETAFGQFVFKVEDSVELGLPEGELRVAHGDVNIGVHGRDFSVIFSKQAASLVSLNYAGKEMISLPPAPLFWRATTDNDRGFSQSYHSGLWYAASLARKCTNIELQEEKNNVSVIFIYKFSFSEMVEVKIGYTVYPDGSIQVKANYQGAENLPQIPIFALSFKVPGSYDQLEWYAMGPEENYSDRCNGARLGIFKNQVSDNLSGYVMPQESGNRTGVRRVKLTNQNSQGIKISTISEPLECNFSPYTAFELENAQHHFELPNIHYTVVTVAGKQMGVGGDNSWGAPVHEEYLIRADQTMEFEFKIQRI
jgi:beta-galactosidase